MLTLPDFPLPDARGRFGPYGGRYVPETLIPALEEVEAAYREAKRDPAFLAELEYYLREFAGRTPPSSTPGGSASTGAGPRST